MIPGNGAPRYRTYTILWMVALSSFALGVLLDAQYGPWHAEHHPLHAVVEGLGAFAALSLALVILTLQVYARVIPTHLWIACAMIGMGLLDGLHAGTHPGHLGEGTHVSQVFVWLHSLATFIGGTLFALAWLPDHLTERPAARLLPRGVFLLTLGLGVFSISYPELLPLMQTEAGFTTTTKALNLLGGLGFFAATVRFLTLWREGGPHARDHLLFVNHCLLFGVAAVLFGQSIVWDANWWLMHVLRLAAYSLSLVYFLLLIRRTGEELHVSYAQLETRVQKRTRELLGEIAERRGAERALRESEEYNRMLFEHSPVGLALCRPNGELVDVNEAYARIVGRGVEDILGRRSKELLPGGAYAAGDHAMRERLESAGRYGPYESAFIHSDGHRVPVCHRGMAFRRHGEYFIFSSVEDFTEIKQAERAREEVIAELESKNAELERFTYTVSHDLKSPLITIRGFAGILRQDLAQGNETRVQRDLQHIEKAADTMNSLLQDLLELSRIGRMVNPAEAVPLGRLVEEALECVAGPLNAKRVEVEVAPDLPILACDATRIREVFQNLIENAQKFMGNQEAPRIEIGSCRVDGETCFFVRDNGIGIDARYHNTIFGLFDRLNSEIDGTGIGLALVNRIIQFHGGRIWVESDGPGSGSNFFFTLPNQHEDHGEAPSAPEPHMCATA